jgi:hypothetical protein
MKKIAFIFATVFLMTGAARAWVDYPFIAPCGDEIDAYCAVDSDAYDCLMEHEDFLGEECFDDFIAFDRDRWAHDSDLRGRWSGMSSAERADFRAHSAPVHNSIEGEHGEIRGFDGGGARGGFGGGRR